MVGTIDASWASIATRRSATIGVKLWGISLTGSVSTARGSENEKVEPRPGVEWIETAPA